MRRLLAVLFALSLMVTGCGGSDDAGSGGSADATVDSGSGSDTGSGGSGGDDGYGGGSGGDTGGGDAEAGTITIADFAYGEPLTVAPEALIRVVNEDSASHDVDAQDGTSFNTDLLGQGEELTFNAPAEEGTYDFTCSEHPQMSGQLIVAA